LFFAFFVLCLFFGILHDQSTNIVHVLCVSRWRKPYGC
jgi:hypothetical protein